MATNQSAAANLKESLKGNRRSLPSSFGTAGGQSSEGVGSIAGQKRKRPGEEGE